MVIITNKRTLILLVTSLVYLSPLHATVYQTQSRWEVDAVLVAWLINRHVETDSEFILVEKGTLIDAMHAINTPNSRFRRSAQETAFESALRQFNIHNSCSDVLTPMIRLIELAPWRMNEHSHAKMFERDILALSETQDISAAFEYIDSYCQNDKK